MEYDDSVRLAQDDEGMRKKAQDKKARQKDAE